MGRVVVVDDWDLVKSSKISYPKNGGNLRRPVLIILHYGNLVCGRGGAMYKSGRWRVWVWGNETVDST